MTHRTRIPLLLPVFLVAVSARALAPFTATPVMLQETQQMVRFLENYHFNSHELSRDDFRQLLPDFISDLDSYRLFFLASDLEALNAKYAERLPKDLRYLGNLDAAFETFKLYRERVGVRVAWITEELSKDFDFTTAESFAWDRSKAQWPATPQEADTLWHARLKFELLEDLLNKKDLVEAKANVAKRYQRLLSNLDSIDSEEVQEIYLTSLAQMYDPHTAYMAPSTVEEFNTQMRLSLIGIGAQLREKDDVCTILELIPGGPADLSKLLRPNDKIVGVAQDTEEFVDVVGMRLRKVVQLIRGKKDTVVRLSVIPADATDPSVRREVRIVRDVVKLNASRARATLHEVPALGGSGTLRIGVIDLPSFYGSSDEESGAGTPSVTATKDVEQLLHKLTAAGAQGVVLDLRRNGGGLLSEAVDLTGLFIAEGPVVQVKDPVGRIDVKADEIRRTAWDGPLAVLTSRLSASASEIVAGALQNYGRAVVVGNKSTHGKGTVQMVVPILDLERYRRNGAEPPRSGASKITIQKFYLPNGASTQNRGVIPDVVIPSIDEFLPIGETDLRHALAWDTIRPTLFDGGPLDPAFLSAVRDRSLGRQGSTEEFGFLRQNIDRFKERDERKSISLNLEQRRRQKADDDTFRSAARKTRADLAKLNFPSTEINLDGVDPITDSKPIAESIRPVDSDKLNAQPTEIKLDGVKPAAESKPPAASKSDEEDPEEREDEKIKFDIYLRESLRVLADAIDLWQQPEARKDQPPAVTASMANRFAPVPVP